ncbi:MAG TPA: protein kinase [Vicinamibacteria bacterium]|nr:protein kinase [Vicinamibacteria bacterium]
MSIPVGTRLGPYEILAPIGAGGMGEVYRARDTRLDRPVAIKVLPTNLAQNADLKQRFEREAKTVSGLSHAHICALYDVGEVDGASFLVMEYLEGESLADRLAKGALPIHQVLRYGIEIADALSVAHRHGVIHRDLKPGNVMLTRSGAKLLDFGLAKLRPPDGFLGGGPLSALPTADKPLTEKGSILGTVQYMAPEQLEGKEADARTDVFALGEVLYEMATGRRAFAGQSRASLIAAILSAEPPPISSIQPLSPPALDRIVRTCLAKDPDERWQSAHDVAAELKWVSEGGSQVGLPAVSAPSARRRRVAWIAGSFAAGALAAGAVGWMMARPAPAPPRFPARAGIDLPSGTALPDVDGAISSVALSPDGRRLVFAAAPQEGGPSQLYLRATDQLEATPIAGTAGGYGPFFSPDGRWIGFFAGRKLKKVAIAGGEPLVICDAGSLRGASWAPDDTILFAPSPYTGLSRVSANGGTPEPVTTVDKARKERNHRWPLILPGGKAALFTVMSGTGREEDRAIEAVELGSGRRRVVVQGGTYPRYAAGHLIYARTGSLLAAPFDADRLAVTGPAVPVLEDVRMDAKINGVAHFDLSASGSLVYVPRYPRPPERTLVWVDRRGGVSTLTPTRRAYSAPALSPDGRLLAVTVEGPNDDVWVCGLAQETWTRLTFERDNANPVWSPDGRRVVFASNRTGGLNLFWVPVNGSGAPAQITRDELNSWPTAVSRDGGMVAFATQREATGWDLRLAPLSGGDASRDLIVTRSFEDFADFSPDGRWLAYTSSESGRLEVYVRPYPEGGQKWPVSRDGGSDARWARSGRELFYRNGEKMIVVPVRTQPEFSAGVPQVLFQGRFEASIFNHGYDVTPDGQRFVMVKPPEKQEPLRLVAIPYWAEEMATRLRQTGK